MYMCIFYFIPPSPSFPPSLLPAGMPNVSIRLSHMLSSSESRVLMSKRQHWLALLRVRTSPINGPAFIWGRCIFTQCTTPTLCSAPWARVQVQFSLSSLLWLWTWKACQMLHRSMWRLTRACKQYKSTMRYAWTIAMPPGQYLTWPGIYYRTPPTPSYVLIVKILLASTVIKEKNWNSNKMKLCPHAPFPQSRLENPLVHNSFKCSFKCSGGILLSLELLNVKGLATVSFTK